MEDQTTLSKPQKAAAESEPETVLPGPRSLSALDKVRQRLWRMKAQALLEQMAAESARATHRSKAKMEVVAVLTKVLAILAEAESEASKENS